MLVLATNRAEDLDAAVLDRCDESLLFPLPDAKCRRTLLDLYWRKQVVAAADLVNKKENGLWKKMSRKMMRKDLVELKIEGEGVLNGETWLSKGGEWSERSGGGGGGEGGEQKKTRGNEQK